MSDGEVLDAVDVTQMTREWTTMKHIEYFTRKMETLECCQTSWRLHSVHVRSCGQTCGKSEETKWQLLQSLVRYVSSHVMKYSFSLDRKLSCFTPRGFHLAPTTKPNMSEVKTCIGHDKVKFFTGGFSQSFGFKSLWHLLCSPYAEEIPPGMSLAKAHQQRKKRAPNRQQF